MAISNPVTIGTHSDGTTATTVLLTTAATVPAGGRIWVHVAWFNASITLSTVSDGANTYTIDVQGRNSNTNLAIASADCPAGLASGATITATFSSSLTLTRFISAEYATGVQTGAGAAYGAVSQNQGAVTAWSSTATTVLTGDILIGATHWEDSVTVTNTPSGGNTEIDDFTVSGGAMSTCYQIGTGASVAATGTWSTISAGTGGNRSSAVAYKAFVDPGNLGAIQTIAQRRWR